VIYKDVGPIGVMVTEPSTDVTSEPTLHDLKALLIVACGTDYGTHSPTWISRFTDATRQAAQYRSGRVLLAGDAAHVHSPVGGMGLGTGLQDAVNLGWKLAQVVKGTSPDSLLDTYHAERHPVGARVLKITMAQVALHREDARTLAARDIVGELLEMKEPRMRVAAMLSGLDIRYDLGAGRRAA
jgi:3-(3-hydroxy-phenyl)propionate hydroxylase